VSSRAAHPLRKCVLCQRVDAPHILLILPSQAQSRRAVQCAVPFLYANIKVNLPRQWGGRPYPPRAKLALWVGGVSL
jgi:hypothetical protein